MASRTTVFQPWSKADSQQVNSGRAKPARRLETNGWKTLVNKHGWSVRYPPSWDAETVGGDADKPEDAFQPILRGPKGCYELNQECGFMQLGSGWHPLTGPQRSMGPKNALLDKVGDSRFVLLQQGDAVRGGQVAYYIVYRMKLYEDYPNGVMSKEIQTQYKDYFYFISMNEESKDRRMISLIASSTYFACPGKSTKWNRFAFQVLAKRRYRRSGFEDSSPERIG